MSRIIGLCLLSLVLLNSCFVSKKVVYVNDMVADSVHLIKEMPVLHVQKSDRLSILVNSKNPELVVPFNAVAGSYAVADNGEIKNTNSSSATGQSYLVDQQGQITFPLLGNLQIEGLSLEEVKNLIQDQLIEKKIVSDPIVKVEILNVKISVMGAVRSETVLNVPDGRITILEAITKAGGLMANAAADKVTVIREENGKRTRIINNITSQKLFESPTYYLRQNDIVYVEPRSAETTPKEERSWRILGTVLGSITLVLSVISIVK
ncbi:MAG: sugar transporter [Sphingobacterium sp.]|nr:sugar transporter [Sphingobacterium sp.]